MHIVRLDQNRHLLPSVATAAARAFTFDSLFLWLRPFGEGSLLTPTPDDEVAPSPTPSLESSRWFHYLRIYFLLRLRSSIVAPRVRSFVAVTDDSDVGWTGTEEVIGYALWQREFGNAKTTPEERHRRDEIWGGDSWVKRVERWCVANERWYVDTLGLDSYYDHTHLDEFTNVWRDFFPYTERILMSLGRGGTAVGEQEGGEAKGLGSKNGYVWLQFLAVDPKFQRRGVGSKLMEWGLKRAEIERVPAGLTASPQGQGLYKKYGFEDVGENVRYSGMEDIFMVAWIPDK